MQKYNPRKSKGIFVKKRVRRSINSFTIFSYIVFAVIIATSLFLAIDKFAGSSPASDGWQNTSNLLNFVVGVPVALVASLVALILAINSLNISRLQHESNVSSAISLQFSDTVNLFNKVAFDVDEIFQKDRELRKYLETSFGDPSIRGINVNKLFSMKADDGFSEIYAEFNEKTRLLKIDIIKLLSNPLSIRLIDAMEKERIKDNSLLHIHLANRLKSNRASISPFSWHLKSNPTFKEFMQEFLIAMGDDISIIHPNEGMERAKNLLFSANIIASTISPEWNSDPDSIPGVRIYNAGGRILWTDYDDMGIVNFGGIFLHDLSRVFPTSDVCIQVVQNLSEATYDYSLEKSTISSLVAEVDLSQVASIVAPTRGVIPNWKEGMTNFVYISRG